MPRSHARSFQSLNLHRTLLGALFILCLLAPGTRLNAQSVDAWKGAIELPGMELEILVQFTLPATGSDTTVTATIDIPAQGAMGVPLDQVVYTDKELRFLIRQAGADFQLTREGESATGELKQMGQVFPVRLTRLTKEEAAANAARRPQTPKPPFPYAQEEVTFTNPDDETTLAGTIIIPEGDGPFPAVVFITGSGPQDRDETIFAHKPFLVIADHLARHGIASLRYDDRGVGGSTGSTMQSTAFDTAGDVMSAIDLLLAHDNIDPTRIGLIGHSEGGIIAPIVAADNNSVRFIVLLAGTGLPGIEVLEDQLRAILINAGVPPEEITRQLAAQQAALRQAMESETLEEIERSVEDVILAQLGLERDADGNIPEQLRASVEAQTAALASPWFQSFLTLDPRTYLRRVKQPVLALNGALDFQVDADRNLSEIEKALALAENPSVTIRKLDRLNHLFQTATTGMMDEYGRIEETIHPEVLTLITEWIQTHSRPGASPVPADAAQPGDSGRSNGR